MLTFLTIDGEMMATMLGYMSDLMTDLAPLWLLIVGVLLVGAFISLIIGSLRG